MSPPFRIPEQFQPGVGVPLPRPPDLAKDLQPSSPAHFAACMVRDRSENSSSSQSGKTLCLQTWLCLKTAPGGLVYTRYHVFPRPGIESRTPGINMSSQGINSHGRRGGWDPSYTSTAFPLSLRLTSLCTRNLLRKWDWGSQVNLDSEG